MASAHTAGIATATGTRASSTTASTSRSTLMVPT